MVGKATFLSKVQLFFFSLYVSTGVIKSEEEMYDVLVKGFTFAFLMCWNGTKHWDLMVFTL